MGDGKRFQVSWEICCIYKPLSDTFSSQDIEEIIRDNQDMSSENQEYFGVDKRILESIFDRIIG